MDVLAGGRSGIAATERMIMRALVLGAGGFLGSHLCQRLVFQGWRVTAIVRDPEAPWCQQRLRPVLRHLRLVHGDVNDGDLIEREVCGQDAVFPFAGRSGAVNSVLAPIDDVAVNVSSHVLLLEALRRRNRNARVVFPGSRLQYGPPQRLPVDEEQPLRPTSPYGINKVAAESYYRLYHQMYGLPTTCLRISNPFGPHQTRPDRAFGVVATFLSIAAQDGTIRLYGGGHQLRDFLYVEDLLDLILMVTEHPRAIGRVYNAGGSSVLRLKEMAATVIRVIGRGRVEQCPWPAAEAAVESGDYVSDLGRVGAEIGWRPITMFEAGLAATWSRELQGARS